MMQASMSDVSDGLKNILSAATPRNRQTRSFTCRYEKSGVEILSQSDDDRFSSLGGEYIFACVDMKGADGTIYDIDFFMVGTDRGIDCDGNVRSQNQRQTDLQLEAKKAAFGRK